ncbi:DUF2586 family protein [Tenacibaculum maritimum]|nr:DUF2586 family protein [Tenacibaculum maritimum]
MNGINFIKQNGGLGRTLAGVTHTSGLIIYGEKGFSTIAIASVEHLEQEGVTSTSNPVLHYHVSEFFRINEGAKLYIQSVATSDGNYTEAKVMQNAANGSIRQFAICDFKTAIGSLSTSAAKLQVIAAEFWDKNIPASFFLSMKVTSADIATLPDLHTLDSENVSVVIGQDGGGRGSYLEQRMSLPSISCIGSVLGAASKANVHESIAWVEKQNLVTSFPYDKSITEGTY